MNDKFSTPQILKIFMGGIVLLTLMYWYTTMGLLANMQGYVKTIGVDSEPSIVAAEEIRARLGDANASAIKALLDESSSKPVWKRYDEQIAAASDQLISAAQNITYGEDERGPILKIAQDLPRYAAAVAAAREAGGKDRAPRHVARLHFSAS